MRWSGVALRLIAHGGSVGAREELIGDLLEAIARGRSPWWVCQQVIGLYGVAFTTHVRHRARLTPPAIAAALSALMLAAISVAPVTKVLEAWLGFYYVAGTLSLFAHMASRAVSGRGE